MFFQLFHQQAFETIETNSLDILFLSSSMAVIGEVIFGW